MYLDRCARIILGYHGAKVGEAAVLARRLLLGEVGVDEWQASENEFDWLGHWIYFLAAFVPLRSNKVEHEESLAR